MKSNLFTVSNKVARLFFILLICAAFLETAPVWGAEPTPHIRPPRIPAQFDRATLQSLLDTIEQPHVAALLKMTYFGGRRSTPGLPMSEGFALLKDELAREPVASKRWFWLQNVRGWAAFRCRGLSFDEGFTAYTELFAQADHARVAKEVLAPQNAVNAWVDSVDGRLDILGLRADKRTWRVLEAAWPAYTSLLKQTAGRWNGDEPDWYPIFIRGSTVALNTAVAKTIADAEVPKTFGILMAAATCFHWDASPQRPLKLLAEAKPLLPKDSNGNIEKHRAEEYFSLWKWLTPRPADHIAVMRERTQILKDGYAPLLKLQLETKDEAGATATLAELAKPDAPEREIVAAAGVLNDRWDKDRQNSTLAKQSETLLNGYLQSAHPRSLAVELEARYRLGWLLLEQKQTGKAKTALDLSALHFNEKLLDSRSRFLLQSIRAMQARLAAKPGAPSRNSL